jgi:hypothetical protein
MVMSTGDDVGVRRRAIYLSAGGLAGLGPAPPRAPQVGSVSAAKMPSVSAASNAEALKLPPIHSRNSSWRSC